MRPDDRYHKWVEWSDEDGTYLGKCPDLISGIHGADPVKLYAELCDTLDEVIEHFRNEGRSVPTSSGTALKNRGNGSSTLDLAPEPGGNGTSAPAGRWNRGG